MFVGYTDQQKDYVRYDPAAKSSHLYVIFLEHVPFYSTSSLHIISNISFLPHFPSTNTSSKPPIIHKYSRHPVPVPAPPSISTQPPGLAQDTTQSVPLRRSTLVSIPPNRYTLSTMESIHTPNSYKEAVQILIGKMQ